MTVADNTSRNQYSATSGQTVFAYTFEIVDKDDVVVLKNGTTLSEGTDYTVSNVGNDSGGNVTLTVGATTGDVLTLYRDMPYARTQNYTNSGDFLASEVNSDFDNLWLAGEQTNRSFSQSIRKPITDSDSISMELPEAADRTDSFLTFDSTGAVSTSPLSSALSPSIIARQQFTGDGSTTAFTLAADPGSPAGVVIYIDGVYQEEGTYSVSGSTVTFTEAPPTNASIEVVSYKTTAVGTTDANSVTYTPAGTGAVQTTVQTKLRESVSVKDFGAVGDGVTDDTAAIQAAIDYAESNNLTVNFDGATYAIGSAISLKNGVSLIGTHMPSADPTVVGVGTTFLRIANIDMLSAVGTNRTTNRIGHNRIQGIQFKDGANIGTATWTNFKYADSVVWQDVTFFQPDSNTTIGTCITAEESWDWRLNNVIWKHCGDSSGTKYPIRIYNGADDSSNDWTFHQCRWQESKGNNIFFDSTGAGNTNAFFWFSQCKFEDTGNASLTNFKGEVNKLFVSQTQFAGCGESQIVMPSTSRDWHFNECLFANGGGTPTQMVTVTGSQISIKQCHFQNPAASVLAFVDGAGSICTISDCTTDDDVPLVPDTGGIPTGWRIGDNAYSYITSNSGTAQIGAGASNVTVTHNLDYTPRMEDITLTIFGLPDNGIVDVIPSSISATTFRIYGVNSTGGTQATTAALNVAWNIRRSRG